MTFLNRLNSAKLDFTQNRSGNKITKYQQSQALTLHFESFWSIVRGPQSELITTLTLEGHSAKCYILFWA